MVSGRYLSADIPLWWTQVIPLLDAGTSSNGYVAGDTASARGSLVATAAPAIVLIKFRRDGNSRNEEEDASRLLTENVVRGQFSSEQPEDSLPAFCDVSQIHDRHPPCVQHDSELQQDCNGPWDRPAPTLPQSQEAEPPRQSAFPKPMMFRDQHKLQRIRCRE